MDLKKFDKEYQTQFFPEVQFLKDEGIKYTFIKVINGVESYKYTKTADLFNKLSFFYSQNKK